MPQVLRGRTWVIGCLLAGALPTLGGAPAIADPGTAPTGFVKYHTVRAIDLAGPDDLAAVAAQVLDDPQRATELFRLNEGRVQPDGGVLTRREQDLVTGWVLVMPWDADMSLVQYGLLPAPARPAEKPGTTPRISAAGSTGGTPAPRPGCPAGATPRTPGRDGDGPAGDWRDIAAGLERADVGAMLVAVVGTGVDPAATPLAERMVEGADITAGSMDTGVDCAGSGTAVAVMVARASAPSTRIMPIRVATTGTADARTAATGIDVAVSAGATAIALDTSVPATDPLVHAAVRAALEHDVVVATVRPDGVTPAAAPDRDDGPLPVAAATLAVLAMAGLPVGWVLRRRRAAGTPAAGQAGHVVGAGIAGAVR